MATVGLLVFLGLIGAVGFWLVGMYNRLIELRNRVKNGFSQIDVQLTRRHDLIPNLVETAKGYLSHERATLEAVIVARGSAQEDLRFARTDPTNAIRVQKVAVAEQQLGGALGRLMALVESYPELKANQNMLRLSEELTSTENRVAFARQAFNDAVMAYNTTAETFPSAIIATQFGFKQAVFFEVDQPAKRDAPRVSFH